MADIRTEINLFNKVETCANSASLTSNECIQVDTNKYDGATYYFEFMCDVPAFADAGNLTVSLRRKGTSTDDATKNDSWGGANSSQVKFRISLTPPAATATEYVVFINNITSNIVHMSVARVVVDQSTATITKTEIQIEIGSAESGTSLSDTAPTKPKYFKYVAADWADVSTNFFFEANFTTGTSKSAATVTLQVADGTGDGFVNWSNVASSAVTTTATTSGRTRSSAITLVDGRNYRIVFKAGNTKSGVTVYGAKLVFQLSNGSGLSKMHAEYLLVNTTIGAGTGLQNALTAWDSTEWSGFSTAFTFVADAANGSTSVIECDTSGGTQVTGSVVSSPDNQGFSSNMTMPSTGNLDCKATTNNNDVFATKIIVFVTPTSTTLFAQAVM